MTIMKRLRQHVQLPAARKLPKYVGRTSRVDIWLQRGSHIAQLGLFVFTIWTIYFTVIPLYQKALLDEQIAQKEIKLAQMEKAMSSAYVKIRMSAVRDYVLHAGAECSGLMIPPEELDKYREGSSKKPNAAKAILAIEPNNCLLRELDRENSLNELTTTDAVFLRREVSRLAIDLEQDRQRATQRLDAAEQTVQANPSLIGKPFGKAGTVGRLLLKDMPPARRETFLTWVAVEAEQYAAADEYADAVRLGVQKLKDLQWPAQTSNGL